MDSGKLTFEDGEIRYDSTTFASWRLRLADIRVIGEATNDSGPQQDDYFLCFACDAQRWFEASFYAAGRDELLSALEEQLSTPMLLQLAGSTDYASRILWPANLTGEPMFDYEEIPPTGLWNRIKSLNLPQVKQSFSQAVLQVLRADSRV